MDGSHLYMPQTKMDAVVLPEAWHGLGRRGSVLLCEGCIHLSTTLSFIYSAPNLNFGMFLLTMLGKYDHDHELEPTKRDLWRHSMLFSLLLVHEVLVV